MRNAHFTIQDTARAAAKRFRITISTDSAHAVMRVRRDRCRRADVLPLDLVARLVEVKCAQARALEHRTQRRRSRRR